MITYSRPELSFVIKFPYNDNHATVQPIPFNYRVSHGYSLAKEYLGGILAPSIDVYGVFTDSSGDKHGIITLVQQKVKTFQEVSRELSSSGYFDEMVKIKQAFVELNQRMWQRGIFDCDTNWEENYGLLPDGALVLIDIGRLSDDPSQFSFFEGIPRIRQYESAIKDTFTDDNFRRFFGTRLVTRKRSSNPRVN